LSLEYNNFMKENKVAKWALILSAVIVANLFFNYSLSLLFETPQYDQYCERDFYPTKLDATPQELETQREEMKECNDAWSDAREENAKKVFVSLISIGVIVLILSAIVKNNSTITSALALTAFLNFIIASLRYWSYSDQLLKVVILFIALIIIFYIIVKKFKDK
jgi:uncharacterized membrane protein YdbT with pleckstrin-like domain